MPHEGQEIVNRRTGQRMRFVRLRDQELVIESVNPPSEVREPEHVHPEQESGAEVHAGALIFEVGGEARRVGPGESISIPAGTPLESSVQRIRVGGSSSVQLELAAGPAAASTLSSRLLEHEPIVVQQPPLEADAVGAHA